MALDLRPFKRVIQNGGQVHRGGPLVDGVLPHLQQVGAAHQLVHGTHPQAGHVLPQLLGHEAHEVHHILRFSGEAPPQLRVLGGDPCRAGAQVAYPHHAAAHGDQGGGGKAELLRPQHAGDGHVPAAHQLAVGLYDDPGAQAVHDQGLVGLGHPQLPRHTGRMDGTAGGGTGAPVIAADQYYLSPGLGHAGGNGANSGSAHSFTEMRACRLAFFRS